MLYTEKLVAELERTRALFASYDERYGQQRETWREALAALGARYPDAAALRRALDAALANAERPHGSHAAGALPTREYDRWRQLGRSGPPVLPFGRAFAHHEESRAWAEGLRGTTTFAVDGSQLLPWRDASVPVALVQAGIFENPHQPPAPYLKDVRTELLPPDDLLVSDPEMMNARTNEAAGYSERIVHLRRFELEVDTLVERLEYHAARRMAGAKAPVVALFDGSLIVSFALKMPPPYPDRYAAAAQRLLDASRRTRIPLLGYIDTSYARDTITLLRTLTGDELPPARGIHDALLWGDALAWGDRTPAFLSAREDLAAMGYHGGADAVAFVYLRAARDRPPARVEFPAWLLEDGPDGGLLDATMDVLRAEIITGQGYPYSIEAADAVAVISTEDRARFYTLFQQFAEREGLDFTFSRKALSKSRRRV